MTELILSAALKGTLVLAAAWLATRLLPRASADVRHKIWLASLVGLVLLLIPVPLPDSVTLTSMRLSTPARWLRKLRTPSRYCP